MLVVEDTPDVGEGIVACIARLGHAVDWANDGEEAEDMLAVADYALVVLDLTLPRRDGISVLRGMRQRNDATPVLILTARSTIDDRVDVLDMGADDYLVKPFDFRELEARVRLLLRRVPGSTGNATTCGDLTFDPSTRIARTSHGELDLTRRELSLLEILLRRQTAYISKAQILEQLFDFESDRNENVVEVLIARLRRKLGPANIEIRNSRSIGYRIARR